MARQKPSFRARQGLALSPLLPKIAIVGRPNVGKSTLFNRLIGKKLALVDDAPGVTRDWREGHGVLADFHCALMDTAGLEEGGAGTLNARLRAQTQMAVERADLVLFMIDARAGVTPQDEAFVNTLRRFGVPIALIANKAERAGDHANLHEAYTLGLGTPLALSAAHGEGFDALYELFCETFPQTDVWIGADDEDGREEAAVFTDGALDDEAGAPPVVVDPTKPLRIAIVGRPNAGKSTLVNRFLGEERMLTGAEPGLTRDTIAVELDWHKGGALLRRLKLYDTAGLRRKARIEDRLEKLSASDTLRAIRFAEIVVLLMDATAPFEKQDLAIASLVESEGRALVLALNKWDLIENRGRQYKKLREMADQHLPQLKGAPLIPLSGLAGEGLTALVDAALALEQRWSSRLSTGKLNRWLEAALVAAPPPAPGGRRIKLRYMTQVKSRPPLFVIFGTQLDKLPQSYVRYLTNGLRDAFDFAGVPIRVSLRSSQNPFVEKK